MTNHRAVREPRLKAHHIVPSEPCGRRHLLRSTVSRTYNLRRFSRRDRNRFRSLQGRVTTATPASGVAGLHGDLTTSHHEGCVSTMLTLSGLSIAPPMRDFKSKTQRNTRSTPFMGLFVLTAPH